MKNLDQVPEVADGRIVPAPGTNFSTPPVVTVAVAPTQVRRPWRSTIRTTVQLVLAIATLLPFAVAGVYEDAEAVPAIVGQVLVVAAAITRVMALPQVEAFLRRFAPWLAAAPK